VYRGGLPVNRVMVGFVVQVGIPGTAGWVVSVVNRACVYPAGGALDACIWSNTVTNGAFRPYTVYLPLALRGQ